MQDNQFYEYASSMLVAAGHMITPSPMYVNHSSNKTLYIDSKKNVIISSIDHALLSSIDNVSLLMEVKWAGVVDEYALKSYPVWKRRREYIGFYGWNDRRTTGNARVPES